MTWVLDTYLLSLPTPLLICVALVTVVAAGVRYVVLSRRGARHPLALVAAEALLVVSVLLVLALTLHPREGGGRVRQIDPYPTGRRTHVGHPELREAESLANLAMLVPVGLALGLRWPRLLRGRRGVALAFGVPVIPELLQFLLPLGRVAALEDIELGACGMSLGLGFGGLVGELLRRREARRLQAWTCPSCISVSATTCPHASSDTTRDSPFNEPSMPRSPREPAHRR